MLSRTWIEVIDLVLAQPVSQGPGGLWNYLEYREKWHKVVWLDTFRKWVPVYLLLKPQGLSCENRLSENTVPNSHTWVSAHTGQAFPNVAIFPLSRGWKSCSD